MDPTRHVDDNNDDLAKRYRAAFLEATRPVTEDPFSEHAEQINNGPGMNALRLAGHMPSLEGSRSNPTPYNPPMSNISYTDRVSQRDEQTNTPARSGSTDRNSQQSINPTCTTPVSWRDTSAFGSSTSHAMQQLSSSSIPAVRNPDAIVPSIAPRSVQAPAIIAPSFGTQQFMPSRDSMAAFYSEPIWRDLELPPRATLTSGFPKNESQPKPNSPVGFIW